MSGLIEGVEGWKPVLALPFAIIWLVVGLNIWKKSKAAISRGDDS